MAASKLVRSAMTVAMSLLVATPALSMNVSRLRAETKLAAPVSPSDNLGVSVSVDGDTAVVGTLDGDAAYLFERDMGGLGNWGLVKTFADGGAFGEFGRTVAISGDTVLIGAPGESMTGAAFLYGRDEGGADNWGLITTITGSTAVAFDEFGWAVAIDGDTALVGARREGGGSAYIFERNNGGPDAWGETRKVEPSDGATFDLFGEAVSLSADTAIVGASFHDDGRGAAYLFERNEGGADNWGETKKLVASDAAPLDAFGRAVALDGDSAVVGAPRLGSESSDMGAAYLFERDSGGADNWGEVLILSEEGDERSLGISVSIDGDVVAVGAYRDGDRHRQAGAAYLYGRDQGGPDNWGTLRKLTAADADEGHAFGFSVALDGSTAIVGALEEDTAGEGAGAAYAFDDEDVCPNTPLSCTDGWGKGAFQTKETAVGKEKLRATFVQGPSLTQAELGTPLDDGSTAYAVCIYDDLTNLVAALHVDRAGGACKRKTCWRPLGASRLAERATPTATRIRRRAASRPFR